MRRTEEEFKAELSRRCENYYRDRKKRNNKMLLAMAPLMAVLIIVAALILPAMRPANKAGPKHSDDPLGAAVQFIDIETCPESNRLARHYTDPEKIRVILRYLNTLQLTPKTEPPDETAGNSYFITVTVSTGAQYTYVHLANRYLRRDAGPWMEMKYEEAAKLEQLLAELPSDERRQK